jgi:hypothetical protein
MVPSQWNEHYEGTDHSDGYLRAAQEEKPEDIPVDFKVDTLNKS